MKQQVMEPPRTVRSATSCRNMLTSMHSSLTIYRAACSAPADEIISDQKCVACSSVLDSRNNIYLLVTFDAETVECTCMLQLELDSITGHRFCFLSNRVN